MLIRKSIYIYKIIKSNSLYLFLARMVVVFFTIIILWSITITIYHSKQISNSIDNLITKDINKYSKIFQDIELTVKNKKYESFIETIKVFIKNYL